MAVLAILALLLLALGAYLWLRLRITLASAVPGVPFVPPAPLIGNLGLVKQHGGSIVAALEALAAKFGDVPFGFWYFGDMWVMVTRHEDVKAVYGSSVYRKPMGVIQKHRDRFLGPKSILFLMNDEWRSHRSAMTKAFHLVELKHMVTDFAGVGARLCAYLASVADSGATIDFSAVIKAATMDAVGLTSFGYDFGAVAALSTGIPARGVDEFQYLLDEITRRGFSMNPLHANYSLPTAANRRHAIARTAIRALVADVVQARREQMATNPQGVHEDLLKHLLTEAEGEDLADNMLTLVFAGFDTTALGLSFAVWLLAKHPGPCAKLHAELDAHMPPDAAGITAEVMGNLRYTRAVFEESLRLYPPVPISSRNITSPVTLSNGVVLPVGTTVRMPQSVIHRAPCNWPDEPDAFKPERFYAPEGGEAPRHPAAAFVPFSIGRRDCVGRNFAMFEGITLLAQLCQRFEFVPQPGYTLRTEYRGFVQGPKGGLPVAVRHRGVTK